MSSLRALWAAAGAVLAASLLVGCASLGRPADATPAETIAGRLSVRVEGERGAPDRNVSAAFELAGSAEQGHLDLSTPIGTVLARARWSAHDVLLTTPQGETRYADLQALTRDVLGEALPVAALFDWLRGRPWPGAESQATQAPEQAGFRQLGWVVTLAHFAAGSVTAHRAQAPAVTVRAVVDRP